MPSLPSDPGANFIATAVRQAWRPRRFADALLRQGGANSGPVQAGSLLKGPSIIYDVNTEEEGGSRKDVVRE